MRIKKNSPVIISTVVISIIFSLSFVLFLHFRTPHISISVRNCIDLIPGKPVFCVESPNVHNFFESFDNTDYGKFLSDNAYSDVLALFPDMSYISIVSHSIRSANNSFFIRNLSKDFLRAFVFAKYADKDYVFCAKLSSLSRIAGSFIQNFYGKKIRPEDISDDESLNSVQNDASDVKNGRSHPDDLFTNKNLRFRSVDIRRFDFGNFVIYSAIIDRFLFCSNDYALLCQSLDCGINGKNEISTSVSVKTAYSSMSASSLIIYADLRNSLIGLFMYPAVKSDSAVVMLDFDSKDYLGKIFVDSNIEPVIPPNTDSPNDLKKVLSQTRSLIFMSNYSVTDWIDDLSDTSGMVKSRSDQMISFLKSGKVPFEDYFDDQGGFSVSLDCLAYSDGRLYPHYSAAFSTKEKDGLPLLRAIHNTDAVQGAAFQGQTYSILTNEGRYYKPASYQIENTSYISSRAESVEEIISAVKGNVPVVADLRTWDKLGEFIDAPCHLIINLDSVHNSIYEFYKYGAERDSRFTITTINSQIMPHYEWMKNRKLHVSFGKKGPLTGRIVVE